MSTSQLPCHVLQDDIMAFNSTRQQEQQQEKSIRICNRSRMEKQKEVCATKRAHCRRSSTMESFTSCRSVGLPSLQSGGLTHILKPLGCGMTPSPTCGLCQPTIQSRPKALRMGFLIRFPDNAGALDTARAWSLCKAIQQ